MPGDALTVGVFGYYSYRNLGDDIMGHLVAGHIRAEGHRPLVFDRNAGRNRDWGVEATGDIERIAAECDLVVLGGGGLLIPRPLLEGEALEFNGDLRRLLDATQATDTPLYAISVGGAGRPLHEIVPPERHELVRRLRYATVRNEEDLPLLAEAGTEGEALPDIVWTTARRFPVEPAPRRRRRIGINLYHGRSRRFRALETLLVAVARLRRDLDFTFYDIHPGPDGAFKAFAPDPMPPNATSAVLTDLGQACAEAASLDLLLTSRLHLGVVAMSYGVPTVVYNGAEKTRLLYERIGRGDLFWSSYALHKVAAAFAVPGRLDRLIAAGRRPIDPKVIDGADRHFERLSSILRDAATG